MKTGPQVLYRERLRIPVRWWLNGALLVASFWVAMIVAIPEAIAWASTAVVSVLLTLGLRSYGGLQIHVSPQHLTVGRATIEHMYLGKVEALNATEFKAATGVDADARAYLAIRPYLKTGVRVWLDDPSDPTPYWLVASRRPTDLATALSEAAARPHTPALTAQPLVDG